MNLIEEIIELVKKSGIQIKSYNVLISERSHDGDIVLILDSILPKKNKDKQIFSELVTSGTEKLHKLRNNLEWFYLAHEIYTQKVEMKILEYNWEFREFWSWFHRHKEFHENVGALIKIVKTDLKEMKDWHPQGDRIHKFYVYEDDQDLRFRVGIHFPWHNIHYYKAINYLADKADRGEIKIKCEKFSTDMYSAAATSGVWHTLEGMQGLAAASEAVMSHEFGKNWRDTWPITMARIYKKRDYLGLKD